MPTKPTLRTRDTVGLREMRCSPGRREVASDAAGVSVPVRDAFVRGLDPRVEAQPHLFVRARVRSRASRWGSLLKGCDLVVKRGLDARVRLKTHLSSAASSTVHKSNCRALTHAG